jgi:hypothetical protein
MAVVSEVKNLGKSDIQPKPNPLVEKYFYWLDYFERDSRGSRPTSDSEKRAFEQAVYFLRNSQNLENQFEVDVGVVCLVGLFGMERVKMWIPGASIFPNSYDTGINRFLESFYRVFPNEKEVKPK